MRSRPFRLGWLTLVCALALNSSAPAEQAQTLARAEAIFTQGDDFADALKLFRQSYAEAPTWRALNGAALCLEELGRHVDALKVYEELLANHAADLDAKRQSHVRARIRSAGARVGQIHVVVEQPGVSVSVDGEAVLTGPGKLSLWLEPGAHAIEAQGEALDPYASTLRLKPGERQRLSIHLAGHPAANSAPPTPSGGAAAVPPGETKDARSATGSPHISAWIPWTVLGGGVLLAGVGSGLLLKSAADFDRFDESVDRGAGGGAVNNAGDQDLLSRAELEQTLGFVSLALAGTGLAASVVLFAWPGDRKTRVAISPQGILAYGQF